MVAYTARITHADGRIDTADHQIREKRGSQARDLAPADHHGSFPMSTRSGL